MEFFDVFGAHEGHTVDMGHGHISGYDSMGQYHGSIHTHSGGLSTITNAYGVTTGTLQQTLTGIDHRDHTGRLLTHSFEFGGKTYVQDAVGRHLQTIDPVMGTMTNSIGMLQGRFR